jgi:hypothetical protein
MPWRGNLRSFQVIAVSPTSLHDEEGETRDPFHSIHDARAIHRGVPMASVKQPDPTIKTPPGDPKHTEELLDEAIEETFPASDPISVTVDDLPENKKKPPARPLGASES